MCNSLDYPPDYELWRVLKDVNGPVTKIIRTNKNVIRSSLRSTPVKISDCYSWPKIKFVAGSHIKETTVDHTLRRVTVHAG